jgi:hypothetical protein
MNGNVLHAITGDHGVRHGFLPVLLCFRHYSANEPGARACPIDANPPTELQQPACTLEVRRIFDGVMVATRLTAPARPCGAALIAQSAALDRTQPKLEFLLPRLLPLVKMKDK